MASHTVRVAKSPIFSMNTWRVLVFCSSYKFLFLFVGECLLYLIVSCMCHCSRFYSLLRLYVKATSADYMILLGRSRFDVRTVWSLQDSVVIIGRRVCVSVRFGRAFASGCKLSGRIARPHERASDWKYVNCGWIHWHFTWAGHNRESSGDSIKVRVQPIVTFIHSPSVLYTPITYTTPAESYT